MKTPKLLPPPAQVAQLYERYGGTVYSQCRRLLKDPAAAEDALQEVFLKIFTHLDTAPGDEAMGAWVFTIAKRHCLTKIRDGNRRAQHLEGMVDHHRSDNFEERIISRDILAKLWGAAPPSVVRTLNRFHIQGWQQKEIAAEEGKSRRWVAYKLEEGTDLTITLTGGGEDDFR